MRELKGYQIFLIFLLLFTTFCIYIPILDAGYAPTDDWLMLKSYSGALKNLSINYVINTFTHFHEGLYHPLVTLSYSLEIGIFGFFPALFHFDNILLHLINIFLVFLIFLKISKDDYWIAFIVAALFALHPTRVEVTAWISARKDLLYAPFYLLSILFYLKSYKKPFTFSPVHPFNLSVLFFVLSCFSKSMAITLPFVLILIDFYTGNFDKNKIKKYIPYFIIATVFIIITFASHYSKAELAVNNHLSLSFFKIYANFIGAHFNVLFYIDKFLLPINLYCIYPYFYDMYEMPPWFIMYSPLVLYLMIFFVCLSLKKAKTVFFGFMFFLITMAPTSGIFPIGNFVVADRYTYIPYMGLFLIFAKLMILLVKKIYFRFNTSKLLYLYTLVVICICLSIFVSLGKLSYERVLDWKDNMYGNPTKMKYYEFGINKKSGENLKLYRATRKYRK